MAKITIEIDTHDIDARDEAILNAVAQFTTARKTEAAFEPEPSIFTEAPPTKGRGKGKASVVSTTSAAPSKDSDGAGFNVTPTAAQAPTGLFAPPTSKANGAGVDEGEITLPMINALLTKLLAPGSSYNADDLTAIVKEVTNDTAISPKHCDPVYWPEIHARFTALV